MKGEHLGELEELVLLAVCSLPEQAYGVAVQGRIDQVAGRAVALGAVYSALERLERKRCVRSWLGKAEATPGGRRKRYFQVTREGRRRLEQSRKMREAMWKLLQAPDAR